MTVISGRHISGHGHKKTTYPTGLLRLFMSQITRNSNIASNQQLQSKPTTNNKTPHFFKLVEVIVFIADHHGLKLLGMEQFLDRENGLATKHSDLKDEKEKESMSPSASHPKTECMHTSLICKYNFARK